MLNNTRGSARNLNPGKKHLNPHQTQMKQRTSKKKEKKNHTVTVRELRCNKLNWQQISTW